MTATTHYLGSLDGQLGGGELVGGGEGVGQDEEPRE